MGLSNVYFVTLGCASNRADSASAENALARAGHTITDSAQNAQTIVVNTCALTESDIQASIDEILDVAAHKSGGALRTLVVMGCLGQRFGPSLRTELPEIDILLGPSNVAALVRALGARDGLRPVATRPAPPGQVFRPLGYPHATIKLSEGCDMACAFCVVPTLRGPQRSRPLATVAQDLERALAAGATTVQLTAHNLNRYGADLHGSTDVLALFDTVEALGQQAGRPVWIYPMHAYPKDFSDALMDRWAQATCIVPYVDLPLQHISDPILSAMRRGVGRHETLALIARLRARMPQVMLRSTLMTGLPHEDEHAFRDLIAFVEEVQFDRLTLHAYDPQGGTPAARLDHAVPREVALERCRILRDIQADLVFDKSQALVGECLDVWVEGPHPETKLLWQGRHRGQCFEDDGLTYITGGRMRGNQIIQVRVEQAHGPDVAGPRIEPLATPHLAARVSRHHPHPTVPHEA